MNANDVAQLGVGGVVLVAAYHAAKHLPKWISDLRGAFKSEPPGGASHADILEKIAVVAANQEAMSTSLSEFKERDTTHKARVWGVLDKIEEKTESTSKTIGEVKDRIADVRERVARLEGPIPHIGSDD